MREWGHGGCLRFPDFLPLPMSPPRGGDGNLGPAWKTPPLGLGPGHCLAWQPPWPGHRARSASAPGGCCRPCRPSPSLAQQDRKPGVSSPWKSPRVARATTRPPPQWVARGPMGTCGGRGSEQESPSPLTWHSGLGGCWGGVSGPPHPPATHPDPRGSTQPVARTCAGRGTHRHAPPTSSCSRRGSRGSHLGQTLSSKSAGTLRCSHGSAQGSGRGKTATSGPEPDRAPRPLQCIWGVTYLPC